MPNSLTKEAPYKGPGADSEEKHEPVSDIDTAVADSLKVLDLERPIREADSLYSASYSGCDPEPTCSPITSERMEMAHCAPFL